MKRFLAFLTLLAVFAGSAAPLRAAESASPYDSVVETSKTTTSTVDAVLDAADGVNKASVGQLAEQLKNSSVWSKLSDQSKNFLSSNFSKLGPLVKKLGWIVTALDLAPSVYNTVTSFFQKDKQKFKESFRDTTLKTVSVLTGLAIGAAVSAAIPLVVAGTAATGGALLVVAAGGVIVSVGAGMLVDNIVKNTFSKSIEDFAGNLYDDLIGSDTLSSILKKPGGDGGGGGRKSGSGGRGDGPVTLDALQW